MFEYNKVKSNACIQASTLSSRTLHRNSNPNWMVSSVPTPRLPFYTWTFVINSYKAVRIDLSAQVTQMQRTIEQNQDTTKSMAKPPILIRVILTLESADDKILELVKMSTQLEPLKRHQDVKAPRSKNAGAWLLNLESFSKWRDSNTIEEDGQVFCCFGIPGAGKTVIRYIQSIIESHLVYRMYSVTDFI